MTRHLIIGTAGHVDHGKSALIRRLTGIETDRLKEEQERGISIDLGFASFTLPDGTAAGIVDVPGHERFIHNMLAGIGGIDLVLLVIDVREGIMPQTVEHLAILQLLQIRRGIVVLTKCDLVDDDWLDLVEEEVRDALSHTFFAQAPICRVSSVTGAGIDKLVTTIMAVAAETPLKDSGGPLRLAVDRHFTLTGHGTIVTGTLLSGTVRPGESVEVLPPGEIVRVREVQVHGQRVSAAGAGQRVALNLAGLDRADIGRGAIVGTPGLFRETGRIDVRLQLLPTAPRPLRFRDPVHLYLGTARTVGIVALLDCDSLDPGKSALVQIHLDPPVVAHRDDRFIIRSYSPMTTIGGGIVIDPAPARHRRYRAEVMQALADLESGERAFILQRLEQQQAMRVKDLESATGLGRDRILLHLQGLEKDGRTTLLAEQWVSCTRLRSWEALLLVELDRFHQQSPLLFGMPHATLKGVLPKTLNLKAFDALLDRLASAGKVTVEAERVWRRGFIPQPDPVETKLIGRIETAYHDDGVQAKNRQEMLERLQIPAAVAEPLFAYLSGTGRLVRLNDESYLHRTAYDAALAALLSHFSGHETLTLGEFRDLIGSSRKLVQALLEYWDERRYTLRRGDARVAWNLPTPPSPPER